MKRALSFGVLLSLFTSCSIIRMVNENRKFNDITIQEPIALPGQIPFEWKRGKIIIRATLEVNGKRYPGLFGVDSGAPTVLAEKFVERTGLVAEASEQMISTPTEGTASKPLVKKLRDISFLVGPARAHYEAARVMGIFRGSDLCEPLDGIIGADLLRQFNISIDFTARIMTLFSKSKELPAGIFKTEPLMVIPFGTNNIGGPLVKANVGGLTEELVWDLGYNGAFIVQFSDIDDPVFKKYISDSSELDVASISGAISSGFGKDTQTSKYYRKKIQAIAFGNRKMEFPDKVLNMRVNPKLYENHGNIGTAFMSDYVNFINWDTRTIYLFPSRNKAPEAAVITTIYAVRSRDGYAISLLSTNAPWTRKGLRIRDELISIDGSSIEDIVKEATPCSVDSLVNGLLKQARSLGVKRGSGSAQYTI